MSENDKLNNSQTTADRSKPDVSKYALQHWDDERIRQAAAGLERYAPTTKGQGIMFSIIPGAPVMMAPTHYVSAGENDDQRGTYICLRHLGVAPICCEALEEPIMRVNVLAAIYVNTNNAGRLMKGTAPEVIIGYIRLSAFNHKTITNMLPDGVEASQVDIIIAKAGRVGYEFVLPSPGNKPRYVEAGLQDEVMRAAEKWMDGVALVKRLGKELSPLGWKLLLKHLKADAEDVDETETSEDNNTGAGPKAIGEPDDDLSGLGV
jgi:hypothetical protein